MDQQILTAFWSIPQAELLARLGSAPTGLSLDEAERRLAMAGANLLRPKKRTDSLTLLLSQYKSPIILILVFACLLSFALGDHADAIIILTILLVSGLLGFWQERGATDAVAKLLAIVQIKATVRRQGEPREIPLEEIVPGDVVLLKAGDVIPGDCLILESKDLFVDEAALTIEISKAFVKNLNLSPTRQLRHQIHALRKSQTFTPWVRKT